MTFGGCDHFLSAMLSAKGGARKGKANVLLFSNWHLVVRRRSGRDAPMARPRTFRGNVPTNTHAWDLHSPNLPISQRRKQHAHFLSRSIGA